MSKFDEIDCNKLVIDRFNNNNFGNTVYVKYEVNKSYKQPIRVVLPKMRSPFGAKESDVTPGKIKMQIGFDGLEEETPLGRKLAAAHKKMKEIDAKIIDLLINKKECNLTGKSHEEVEEMFRGAVQESKSISKGTVYPDKIVLRLQKAFKIIDGKRIETEGFQSMRNTPFLKDASGNEITDVTFDNIADIIPPGSYVKPVIELSYVFITLKNKKPYEINSIWTLVHGIVVPGSAPTGFLMPIDDDEELKSENEDQKKRLFSETCYGGYPNDNESKKVKQEEEEEEDE